MKKYTNPLALFFLFFSISFASIHSFGQENSISMKERNKKMKKFSKEFSYYVYLPSGYYTRSIMEDGEIKTVTDTIHSFYMYSQEISNINYKEFLHDLKQKGDPNYDKMLPDTNVWKTPQGYNEMYADYYFRHPAYHEYPVVGVSYEQATAYCEWITDFINNSPTKIFEEVKFRLPTEAEWMYAASGGLEYSEYPWGGPYLRNAQGEYLANFLRIGNQNIYRDTVYRKNDKGEFEEVYIYRANGAGDYLGVAGSLSDWADVTAPCSSYNPNGYGLYNMAGNVAEMVLEEGITHGGSWADPGHYLKNSVRQFYTGTTSCSNKRGFRIIMQVVKY